MHEKLICVTGGSGYVGSWIVKTLLDKNYNVNATCRKIGLDSSKHLTKENLSPNSSGRLTLFEADLLEYGSFDRAVHNCDVVIHNAAPFLINKAAESPEINLIKPALDGTTNVLNACNRASSVQHVIMTSSVAAISARGSKEKIFTEQDWALDANVKDSPYEYSKFVAEKKAWEMCKEQDRWKLTVINSGFCLGPILSGRENDGSIGIVKQLLNGRLILAPNFGMSFVDVRDTALAHVLALEMPELSYNERFICTSESLYMRDLTECLKKKYRKTHLLPIGFLPRAVLYMMLPFLPLNSGQIERYLNLPLQMSNQKIRNRLNLDFIPISKSINEMAQSCIDWNLVRKNYFAL